MRTTFAFNFQRLLTALLLIAVLVVIGTVGLMWIERADWITALYMTVITISTVGYGEIEPLSTEGRIFIIGIVVAAVGVTIYATSVVTQILVSGELREQLEQRREHQMIEKLANHIIVCGYGRVGRNVANELRAEKISFVVIDPDAKKIEHLHAAGDLALQGNAANEAVLQEAGIARARGLVAAVNSDAENVFIVLTAREMQPNLFIVARANFETSEPKLLRAGANRVLSPYRIAGRRMVTMIARPEVADFIDEVAHVGSEELLLEQIELKPDCELVGKTIEQAALSERFGVTIVACRTANHPARRMPGANTCLEANMQLLALGTQEQLQMLLKLASGEKRA